MTLGFGFALAGAALIQLFHWQKVLRAQKRGKWIYATGANILVDLLIVLCSGVLGLIGVLLIESAVGYLAAAMIGMAPLPTLKFLWKRFMPAPKEDDDDDGPDDDRPPPAAGGGLGASGGGDVRPQGGDFDFGETGGMATLRVVRPKQATFGQFLNPEG